MLPEQAAMRLLLLLVLLEQHKIIAARKDKIMYPDNCNGVSKKRQDDNNEMFNRIEALRIDLLETISVSNSKPFNSSLAETAAQLKCLRKFF